MLRLNANGQPRSVRFLLSNIALAIAALPIASNIAVAQQTCDTNSCNVDLYQSTLDAIQAYGYQPIANSVGPISIFKAQSISGGVITSSPMTITTPSGQGMPTEQVLASHTVYACPGGGGQTGVYSMTAQASNTTTITSNQSVTNTSSEFNNNSASVTIGYTPPSATGGVSGSANYSYEWGHSNENSSTTGSGTSDTTSTGVTFSDTVNYNVPEGYKQSFQMTNSVVSYSGADWVSNIYLGGPITNVIYKQVFRSSQAPTYTTTTSSGSAANVWTPPMIWRSNADPYNDGWLATDGMASPNGAYFYFPNGNAYFTGLYWTGTNQANWHFSEGGWNGTGNTNAGMILRLDTGPCAGDCAGTFWATDTTGKIVTWDSNTSPATLSLDDNGYLNAYDSNGKQLWSSGTQPASNMAPYTLYKPLPSTLLGNSSGQAFTASGTYSSTTYNTVATVVQSAFIPLTTDDINKYCSTPVTSNHVAPQRDANEDGYYMKASYNPNAQAGAFVLAQNHGNDDEARRHIEKLREAQHRSDPMPKLRQNIQQNQTNGPLDRQRQRDVKADDLLHVPRNAEKRTGVKKLEKIKGPLVLRRDQFYATNLPGFKVIKVTVNSSNLNNYVAFGPGPSTPIEDVQSKRTIKLKLGKPIRNYSVKPRGMI